MVYPLLASVYYIRTGTRIVHICAPSAIFLEHAYMRSFIKSYMTTHVSVVLRVPASRTEQWEGLLLAGSVLLHQLIRAPSLWHSRSRVPFHLHFRLTFYLTAVSSERLSRFSSCCLVSFLVNLYSLLSRSCPSRDRTAATHHAYATVWASFNPDTAWQGVFLNRGNLGFITSSFDTIRESCIIIALSS